MNSVTLPDNLKDLGGFSYCINLTSIKIPNSVECIDQCAFSGCTNLTSIEIPNSVERIESEAFKGCTNLTSIEIPNSIEKIEYKTFEDCTSLKKIILPSSIESLSFGIFSGCTNLKTVICLSENLPETGIRTFDGFPAKKATLVVPEISIDKYRSTYPWNKFGKIIPYTGVEDIMDFENNDDEEPSTDATTTTSAKINLNGTTSSTSQGGLKIVKRGGVEKKVMTR